jgi:hypothetical protein
MFEVVKQAKIKPVDLAKFLNVSRVTVSLWLNGHKKPHHLLRHRVDLFLKAVKMAVDSGSLPLPADTKRADRFHKISEALEAELHDMDRGLSDVSGLTP